MRSVHLALVSPATRPHQLPPHKPPWWAPSCGAPEAHPGVKKLAQPGMNFGSREKRRIANMQKRMKTACSANLRQRCRHMVTGGSGGPQLGEASGLGPASEKLKEATHAPGSPQSEERGVHGVSGSCPGASHAHPGSFLSITHPLPPNYFCHSHQESPRILRKRWGVGEREGERKAERKQTNRNREVDKERGTVYIEAGR